MTKQKRIAAAYLASFAINGVFWLAYARELRQASANTPKAGPVNPNQLKPLVLGQFKPLPPLPKKEVKPPAAPESRLPNGSTGTKAGSGQTASAAGSSALAASGLTQQSGASLSGAADLAAARAAAIHSGKAAHGQGNTHSAETLLGQNGSGAQSALGKNKKSGMNGQRLASTHTSSGKTSEREDPSASSDDSQTSEAPASDAQTLTAAKKLAAQAAALKATALTNKDGDDRQGRDSKTPEPTKAVEDKKKPPKPGQKVLLKVIKMWTPKPGQKFNLATNLNIALPPTLTLVPGPPLTPEQLAEVQKLLRQQKLKHVVLDRKQLKKLIAAQRIAEDSKKPEKDKPGDEGRKREAKHEASAHTPSPHPAAPKAKPAPKAAMVRPRSPFTYKQWNSDMYRRWQPLAAEAPPPEPSISPKTASADAAQAPVKIASSSVPNTAQAAVPAAGQPAAANNPPEPTTGDPSAGQPGDPAAADKGTPAAPNGQAGQPGTPPANPAGASEQTAPTGNTAAPQGKQPGVPAKNANGQGAQPGAVAGQPTNPASQPVTAAGQPGQPNTPAGQPGGAPPPANLGTPGQPQGLAGQAGQSGQPQANAGQPQGQPGATAGQPGQPQANAGQPGAMPGQNPGQPGQPGAMAGQPGNPGAQGQSQASAGQPQGQPGAMAGQPAANAGQPQGQPGAMARQPGNPAGQPGQPGQTPGAMAGQLGQAAGQAQAANAGQPGAMAGQPGQPAGQGQPAGAVPPAAANPGADAGTQAASLDSAAAPGTAPASGGVLSGEQNDGMTDTPEENLVAADNTETTGFDTPENHSFPDMPSAAVGGDKKGIPGALILPPSPPMGTDTGKNPTPHPVKTNILTRATGKTAAPVSPPTEIVPLRRAVAPRKAVPLPVGMPKKPEAKAVPPALTIGSTSQRGTVPMVVLMRPHLALGTVADTIDPPLPPAKGTPRARTVARHQDAVHPLTAQQTPMPTESAPPTESIKKTPPLVRQVKNSEGIKDGTEQPLPPTPLPDSDMEIGDGSGLKGDYYEGRRFDQFQFTKADANVNFVFSDMPGNSPSPKIAAGSDYTIRWTGKIAARFSETYTFYATVDDGVRVWINHKLIIDDWTLHAAMEFSNKFTFQAGEQYPIKVEYLESAGGAALIHLYWSSASQPKEFIPEDAFFYPLPSDEQDLKRDKAPL